VSITRIIAAIVAWDEIGKRIERNALSQQRCGNPSGA
jgi:hypothetical protein